MINWAYIAGFFDGEGNLGYGYRTNNTFSPRITLCQSKDRGYETLKRIKEFLEQQGLQVGKINKGGYSKLTVHQQWTLQFSSRNSLNIFFKNTLPYLQIKKNQCEDCQRLLKLFPSYGKYRQRDLKGKFLSL